KALPGSTFVCLNHSLILNTSQIEELQVMGGDGNHVRMKDGRIVALTPQLGEMESLLRHAADRTTSTRFPPQRRFSHIRVANLPAFHQSNSRFPEGWQYERAIQQYEGSEAGI